MTEKSALGGREINLVCIEIHLAGREIHLICIEIHLVGREIHLVCIEMHLVCSEIHLVCREMHLVCRGIHLVCREIHWKYVVRSHNSEYMVRAADIFAARDAILIEHTAAVQAMLQRSVR